jgi:Kdo2-lipid IVA lauroyltransferase/acyltransferase
MADGTDTPSLGWLFEGPARRRRMLRYWIRDPAVGAWELAVHRLGRLLPIDWCSDFGAVLTTLTRRHYPASDFRARQLWKALRPDESAPDLVDAAIDRLWRNVGRTMQEYSIIDRLWEAGRVSVSGMDHLDRARDRGQPILVATVHLGNWETVLVAGVANGYHGSGLYEPRENRFEDRIALNVRSRYGHGARFVAAGPHSLRVALRELKSGGGPFIIYVDEFIRGRVQAPLFGRALRLDSNIVYAVRLALMTGAALIPAYGLRVNDSANFEVHVLPPLEMINTPNRDNDIVENVKRLDGVLAPIIRAHLDQWFFALDFEYDEPAKE